MKRRYKMAYGLYKGSKLISLFQNEQYAKHKAEVYKTDRTFPGVYYVKEIESNIEKP
jgi:hypothetical protein